MSSPLLSLKNLSVSFGGVRALTDVSISVERNSVVGLIGPNGAGKTTLFNCISGLVKSATGTFEFEGIARPFPKPHELANLGITRTLQGVGLFNELSVIQNVMVGADKHYRANFFRELFGLSGRVEAELRERAEEALAWTGASALINSKPSELSYPDSKRVSLARALVATPKLLLLDEPAAGLGQDDIDALAALIKEIKRRCAVLIVEHHVDFVREISDSVTVLNFGKSIATGTYDEIKQNPAVVEAYLGNSDKNDQNSDLIA
ncbi:MAG: ABC transporter ATP-binding protein [SAR202 cluster bacterium]|nr:ABC transporter ATP-binding protein [SAR202 cluster bacterium]